MVVVPAWAWEKTTMSEVMFATRCVACDEAVTESDRTIVAKGKEYCSVCLDAIWDAKRASREKARATRRRMLEMLGSERRA